MDRLAQYEFIPGPLLGEGGFSKVYKVKHILTGQLYALKVVDLEQLSPQDINNLTLEVTIHSGIENDLIVNLESSFQIENQFYILLEYMSNSMLFFYIRPDRGLSE